MAVRRETSKVLLVDERRRVLLLSGIDRTKPEVAPWWFPVGGGIEPGESPEDAAIREVREETGLRIEDPGPVLFTRSFTWDFEGQEYDQHERFFLVRVEGFEPMAHAWTDTESATIRATRWWTVDELRSTDAVVFPQDLADTLSHLVPDV